MTRNLFLTFRDYRYLFFLLFFCGLFYILFSLALPFLFPLPSTTPLKPTLSQVIVLGSYWDETRWDNANQICSQIRKETNERVSCDVVRVLKGANLSSSVVNQAIVDGQISCSRSAMSFWDILYDVGEALPNLFLFENWQPLLSLYPGKIALALTYVQTLENWVKSIRKNKLTFPCLLILEDDVAIDEGFVKNVNLAIRDVPEGWDVVDFFEHQRTLTKWFLREPEVAPNVTRLLWTFSQASALVYSPKGARSFLHQLPVDNALDFFIARQLRNKRLRVFHSHSKMVRTMNFSSQINKESLRTLPTLSHTRTILSREASVACWPQHQSAILAAQLQRKLLLVAFVCFLLLCICLYLCYYLVWGRKKKR